MNKIAMNPVKREQISILVAHRFAIALWAVCGGLLMFCVLWKFVSPTLLFLWYAVLVAVAGYRWWLSVRIMLSGKFKHKSELITVNNFQLFSLATSAIVYGMVWGSVLLLFFPQDPLTLGLILGMHGSYISAAASSTCIYLPVFFGFTVTSTVLVCMALIVAGVKTYWLFAIMMLLYLLVSVNIGLRNNRAFTDQIKLRIENSALMAELADQRDRAESAVQDKNSFLADVGHDLRQPVHALGLFVDSLESYQQSEAAHKILDKIRQAIATLGSLFHGLLDVSKLDAGIVENQPQAFELDSFLEGVQYGAYGLAAEKDLILNFPDSTGICVNVDPVLLERIVSNLISNAIKYTSVGEVTLHVSKVRGNSVRLDVVDTGCGIPDSELKNIFREYHQLDNSERDGQKGLRLGLSIVRRLCKLMDISVSVKSRLGEGSTFSVLVPEGQTNKLDRQPDVVENSDQLLRRIRIIVIDDELPILEGMFEILSSWGCEVITADTPQVAIEKVSVFGLPDLIITDLRLRNDENGIDTIRAIRDKFLHEIPAILITGDTAVERLQQTPTVSVRVLHKPVLPQQLRNAIIDQMMG